MVTVTSNSERLRNKQVHRLLLYTSAQSFIRNEPIFYGRRPVSYLNYKQFLLLQYCKLVLQIFDDDLKPFISKITFLLSNITSLLTFKQNKT